MKIFHAIMAILSTSFMWGLMLGSPVMFIVLVIAAFHDIPLHSDLISAISERVLISAFSMGLGLTLGEAYRKWKQARQESYYD